MSRSLITSTKTLLPNKGMVQGSSWISLLGSTIEPTARYCCHCSVMSDPLWHHGLQHARLPCPSLSPGVCSNSCPSSWWCHPTIASSVTSFSSCLQSFPALGSSPMSWLFPSRGRSIATSASASVLPMNIQDWFPLGLTSWIALLSKRFSRIFSDTTIWKHQLYDTQPSL